MRISHFRSSRQLYNFQLKLRTQQVKKITYTIVDSLVQGLFIIQAFLGIEQVQKVKMRKTLWVDKTLAEAAKEKDFGESQADNYVSQTEPECYQRKA